MILGLIFVAITIVVLGLLLFPLLLKPAAASQRVDYDIVVYRDQLAEVDKDVERGLLSSVQADAARAEIYRRMLAAEDAEAATILTSPIDGGRGQRSRIALAVVILALVPLGAGIVYANLGSPELSGKPYARQKNATDPAVATEMQQLATQLKEKPDAEGYKRLGDGYYLLRSYDDAAVAYQKAIAMNGGNADIWSELGETIALAHDDLVVPDARKAFVSALQFDPHDARARFYLGLLEAQIGEPRRAVAIWRDLEKDSPKDAPWLDMIKEHIASFAKDGGFDPLSIPPSPPSLTSPHDGATMRTPSASDSLASAPKGTANKTTDIMAMDPSDQNSAIHSMVDRLEAKLKNNPADADGWSLLATSYRVLGEADKANAAENKAAALKAKASNNEGTK